MGARARHDRRRRHPPRCGCRRRRRALRRFRPRARAAHARDSDAVGRAEQRGRRPRAPLRPRPPLRLARALRPIPRSAYLSRTQLKEQEGRFVRVVKQTVDESSLPESLGSCGTGCFLFLDARGVEPDPPKHSEAAYDAIENKLLRGGAKTTVYYHVTRYDDTGDYALQYWFLYFFNYRLNEHESDWEQITLRLDEDKKPIGVFYSAHEGGNTIDWAKVETQGDHPVDYPARGSHANYTGPGRHRVTVGCKRVLGSIEQCIRGRTILVDVSDAKGTELAPGAYDLAELTGPIFAGSYGSGNYVILTRRPDVLSDPRRRTSWADPLRPFR